MPQTTDARRGYSTAGWPKSPYSKALHDELDFLCRVNQLMRGQPHVGDQAGCLTRDELDAMDMARVAGMTPDVFVDAILASRRQRVVA